MMKRSFVCAVAAVAITASADDFPLTFRTIPDKDVMTFVGGTSSYGHLTTAKPDKLRKEPKAVSRHPLYGECGGAGRRAGFIFRLDEPKGDGKGYDQLIVDMNQNGDLTDDAVAPKVVLPGERRTASPDQGLFGPIQAPADKMVAGGRPIYFAHAYIFNLQFAGSSLQMRNLSRGQLMLKAGWYADTTVKFNGLEQKVGVLDGDCNLHLGDVAQPQTYANRGETTWYFQGGDSLLVDPDGSGSFESDVFQRKVYPFGPILYLGSTAYSVGLGADGKALHVEPWAAPLAEVTLQPGGEQVRDVTLAWERTRGTWQLLRPPVTNGKVMVPPGDYRLYRCDLLGRGASGDQVWLSGMQRIPQKAMTFTSGMANNLDCGGPLQIKVTATKRGASASGMMLEDGGYRPVGSGNALLINASVIGAGGEIYSTFLSGPRFKARPAKPTFNITEAGGKTVASGNLEYG